MYKQQLWCKLIITHTFRAWSLFVLAVIRRYSGSATLIILTIKITDRHFRYASLCIWNQLPSYIRKPHYGTSSSIFDSTIPSHITITSSASDSTLLIHNSYFLFGERTMFYMKFKMQIPKVMSNLFELVTGYWLLVFNVA